MLKHIISAYRQEFRMWMRQRTRPVSVEEAEEKRFFWAKMYAITCLLFLFFTTHKVYRNQLHFKNESGLPDELASSFIFTSEQPVRVLKYEGFTKVKDVTYSTEELKQFLQKPIKEPSIIKDSENSVTN